MGFYDDVKKELRKYEGVISHMYLDTVGKVTVGVGFMIPNAVTAATYGFVVRATKKKATDPAKKAEWTTISKKTKAKRASWYRQFTTLELPNTEIDRLLIQKVKKFEGDIAKHYKNYSTYPEEARRALIDMAFNMGVGTPGGAKGLLGFRNMKTAIESGDWEKAAKESKRPKSRASRNKHVSDLFKAAGKKVKAKAAAK